MAEIKPIRAWRYSPKLEQNIEALTSSHFDSLTEKHRNELYYNPLNSIHLSAPKDSVIETLNRLEKWKKSGVIVQDRLPAIYVYYQYFSLPNSNKRYCRKGFICHIRAHDWEEKIVLRHEDTIPSLVKERTEILEKLQLHSSPTVGLYSDISNSLESAMDDAITNPIFSFHNYQGLGEVLAVIHDAKIICKFIEAIKGKSIVLADGHHRYQASLNLLHEKKTSNSTHKGNEGYNYHLMYLSNIESNELSVLPTHRIIANLLDFSEIEVLAKLRKYFIISLLGDNEDVYDKILPTPRSFGLIMKDKVYKIELKSEAYNELKSQFPPAVSNLDLTALHYFIIEKTLGIANKFQSGSDFISYEKCIKDCKRKVFNHEAQMAVITREISFRDVKLVCESGHILPQKSTYFYPKITCGFVFTSIDEREFKAPDFSPFN